MPSPLQSTRTTQPPTGVELACEQLAAALTPAAEPEADARLASVKAQIRSCAVTLRAALDELRACQAELDPRAEQVEISTAEGRQRICPGDTVILDGDYLPTDPERLLSDQLLWLTDESDASLATVTAELEALASRDERATCAENLRAGIIERWDRLARPRLVKPIDA